MAGTLTQTAEQKDYEDYISLLPDCLIHHVFSSLPTRDAVKTCVLSKRWRSVWTNVSDLRFSVSSYDDTFVDRVLTLYVGRKVKTFHLDIKQDYYHSIVDSWVHFAIDHQVEDLLLNLNISPWDFGWKDYTLSPLLNNCSSVTKLCLRGCRFSSRDSISLSSLKSLSIQNVSDDVLRTILMGSPVLEHLNLIDCRSVKGIQSRSLRELVIGGCWWENTLEILTPCLLSLRVSSAYFLQSIRIIEAPSLVEAELNFEGGAKSGCRLLKELLCKLQNATRILFGAWYVRIMSPLKVEDVQDLLPNCKSLTLHVPIREFSFPAIANMLATTPNLEKLVIKFELSAWDASWYQSNLDSRNVDHKSYWNLKKKFKRSSRHLKNVEIFGFYACSRFKYDEVFTLVKFLLGHASILENMVITKNHKTPEDLEVVFFFDKEDFEVVDSHKLDEMARRLQSYHRASQHAAVVLNYLEEGLGEQHNRGDRVTTKC